jgi:dihydropteroate synthase
VNSPGQNTSFSTNKTLNVKGQIIDLRKPAVMGILNVTPDSFYDGNRYGTEKDILEKAESMLREGASFIDVGGYSSRPGAADVSEQEEQDRTVKAIKAIMHAFPKTIISVDTFRSEVAKAAVQEGASIINDISGGALDSNMFKTVADLQVPYILMHMKGTPQTMNQHTTYANLIKEVTYYFTTRISVLHQMNVKDIVIDPGFGFAKTIQQNFEMMHGLSYLNHLQKPVLVGISRKSTIWKTLSITPDEALNGTTVLNTIAILKGASILRVHDVKEAMEIISLTQQLPTFNVQSLESN